MLDHAEQLRSPDTVFPKLEFSFASEFFSDMEKKLPSMQVPTWDGELYFQYHRGVFTIPGQTSQVVAATESGSGSFFLRHRFLGDDGFWEQHDPGGRLNSSILTDGRLERQFSVSDLG